MSSPSNTFECRWQASRLLLAAYLLAQLFALGAFLFLDLSYSSLGLLVCLLHAAWVLPRFILLTHRSSIRGLRRDTATGAGSSSGQAVREHAIHRIGHALRLRARRTKRILSAPPPRSISSRRRH